MPKLTFKRWRENKGLSISDVFFALGGSVSQAAVEAWDSDSDRVPHTIVRKELRRVYPDCPLAK